MPNYTHMHTLHTKHPIHMPTVTTHTMHTLHTNIHPPHTHTYSCHLMTPWLEGW